MKFSKFLRNVNRGIVLLIIIALCFTGYVAYDYAIFKKEKPAIETLVKEYTEKIPQIVMLPESEQKYQNVSADAVKKKIADNNQLINKYWTADTLNSTLRSYQEITKIKADFEAIIRSTIEKDSKMNGIVLDCQTMIKQVRNVKKISPGVAQAEIEFFLSYDFKGNPLLYSGSDTMKPTEHEPVADNKTRTTKVTNYATTYTLAKTGDGWKIIGLSWSGYGTDSVIIKEGGENDGSSSAN